MSDYGWWECRAIDIIMNSGPHTRGGLIYSDVIIRHANVCMLIDIASFQLFVVLATQSQSYD